MASEDSSIGAENGSQESFEIISEGETQTKSEFLKGYCLYNHIAHRIPSCDSTSEKSVSEFLTEKSKSGGDFSLSLVKTDLEVEQEAKLQKFLVKRLSRSTANNGLSGNLATLSTTDISDKPVTCYYKLIKGRKLDDKTKTDDNMPNNDSCCFVDFLVCFVVNETSKLHLFQQELESYCNTFEASLFLNYEQGGAEDTLEIFKDLESWYDVNILYVCRCTKLFQLKLASLINVGLLGRTLDIVGCENDAKQELQDIRKFVDACSLSGLLSAPVTKENNGKLLEDIADILGAKENSKLTFTGSEFVFDVPEVCEVCKDWAKVMVDGEIDDPVFLKQVMENYKLKVIQDMNSLKRLLMEARTDHYALFRSYLFLSKCPSSPIVMEHIKQEVTSSTVKDTTSIIEVLEDFISEKGGFSQILLDSHTKN